MCEAYLFYWQNANLYADNYYAIERLWENAFDVSVLWIANVEVRDYV